MMCEICGNETYFCRHGVGDNHDNGALDNDSFEDAFIKYELDGCDPFNELTPIE